MQQLKFSFALAGILLLVSLSYARAAVRLDMFVGYDGVVPQASWFPIGFEVQNDGPTFTALVEITPGQFGSSQTRTIQVELPTGTTKRFVVPNFAAASYSPTWNARLLDERGRLRAEAISQRLRRYNDSTIPLAAAITRTMPALPELKSRQEELRPVFARLQPSVFPDNPISLEGLDTLYLSSERALDLRSSQVKTLLAWLHAGGHLMVGLEQISHLSGSGEWLGQILPGEPKRTLSTTHPSLHEWLGGPYRFNGLSLTNPPGTHRKKKPAINPYEPLLPEPTFEQASMQVIQCQLRDGRVLIGPDDAPLAIIAKRGRGQITLLTFAPELEPFRSWKHAPMFWAKMIDLSPDLLSSDRPAAGYYGGRPLDGIFGAMIDSEQARKLPVGWLLLLLVGYLVVIGPLDQYWLKKLNRQMLTWVTFPAYVVFFSLLIYFIGYKLRAGETEWSELHVLDVTAHPQGDTADLRGRSYGSIYSPVNARYTFASDEPFATMRGEFAGHYGGGQDVNGGIVEQRATGFRATAPVPVWTSQLFLSDWWRQGPAPVRAKFNGTEILVENELEVKLTSVRLVEGDFVYELGEVPAQGSKTFPRRGRSTTSLDEFVQHHSSGFQTAVNSRHQAFGDNKTGRIKDWPNASMAASFISTANPQRNDYENFKPSPGFDLSALVERGDGFVLAWAANYSPTKPLNQFPASRSKKGTLMRVLVKP